MVELKHGAHECVLTSPTLVANGICNICYKDKPVEFACDLCNFDLCKSCSHLPNKVSHGFHPEHPLELCVITEFESQNSKHMLCSGCGNLFVASLYYECKACEIFLELGCAIVGNIKRSWDAKEILHYSHAHLLRRCRPGSNAGGSCLMCELPLTPSTICFGCIPCSSFVHERCLDLPREIHHPVHPAHPLIRLDFTHACGFGKTCDACQLPIEGVPLGCPECNFTLHLRCADSLLRSIMHKVHHHKLFYVDCYIGKEDLKFVCGVCNDTGYVGYRRSYIRSPHYSCMECGWKVHFRCVEMPKSITKKSSHIHPLVLIECIPEDYNSLEYCGVCETKVHRRHHVYFCKECDFFGHIECILNKEVPSPLYLKDLYTCGENIRRPGDQDRECETNSQHKIVLNDIKHNHVLRAWGTEESDECESNSETPGDIEESESNSEISGDTEESDENEKSGDISCNICGHRIYSDRVVWICESCDFKVHDSCVKLRQQSRYRFHLKHPLTLLPSYPAETEQKCDICKNEISGFNLFCRVCNYIICASCVVRAITSFGGLQRGQKFIRYEERYCLSKDHKVAQVMVSSSYPVACGICNDRLCGNIWSCMECDEIYHSRCFEALYAALPNHPLHFSHELEYKEKRRSKCNACKLDIVTKYCYLCSICDISFHFKCIEAVGILARLECDNHCLYKFWRDDSSSAQPCMVCKRPCDASFYGCNNCNFKAAHAECIGLPSYVKNQRHEHIVQLVKSDSRNCSICHKNIPSTEYGYYCDDYDCQEMYHLECIMPKVEGEAATEEDQIIDIRLTYTELDRS